MKLPFPIKNTLAIARYGCHVLRKQAHPGWAIGENLIQFLDDVGVTPVTCIDVGAHESEIPQWLIKRWPDIRIISFEPDPICNPLGEVHRMALDNGIRFQRFDSLKIVFNQPCVLKVDCEYDTGAAIQGFGSELNNVDVLVAEMWNNIRDERFHFNQQTVVWECALAHGLRFPRVVDVQLSPQGILHYDIAFSRSPVVTYRRTP
jgi:hypothetical protein